MTMVEEEVNDATESVLATLQNIEQLKSEQEKCLRCFIVGNDFVGGLHFSLLSRGWLVTQFPKNSIGRTGALLVSQPSNAIG